MTDSSENHLHQVHESFLGEVVQKADVVEKSFVGLFTEFYEQCFRERFEHFNLFIILKGLFDPVLLLDEICDFGLYLVMYKISVHILWTVLSFFFFCSLLSLMELMSAPTLLML